MFTALKVYYILEREDKIMEEDVVYDWETLCNVYDYFIIKKRSDYWAELIIEYILQNFTKEQIDNMQLTYKKIDNIVTEILCDDSMWKEIDYAIADIVGKNIKEK